MFAALARAVLMHENWCGKAKQTIYCWVWAAKRELGVAKDVRVLNANLVWEERHGVGKEIDLAEHLQLGKEIESLGFSQL